MYKRAEGFWETSVGMLNGEVWWSICRPGGGDMIADLEASDPDEAQGNAYMLSAAPRMHKVLKEISEDVEVLRWLLKNKPDLLQEATKAVMVAEGQIVEGGVL